LDGQPGDQRRQNLWIGITNNDWFDVVSSIGDIDEVNFWQLVSGYSFMGSKGL